MPKKKESAQELATKADVQVVDKKVQALDQKVQALDHKVNNIAIKVVTIESDLKEVKENMLTKADKNEIMNSMDNLMGEVRAMRQSVLIRGEWKEEHDTQLEDHEQRIKKLETSVT